MQILGLELRKSNQVQDLYKQVDATLEKHNILHGEVSTSVQTQTIAHALHDMMKADKWLNICKIKECAEIAQVAISHERMSIYQAAHCINWNKMTPEYRQQLIAMILDDFTDI